MKRVLVIGPGGAGKSTFSKRLGAALQIEVIHLDTLFWRPGWVETPRPEWREIVGQLLTRKSWIIDGNYSGTLDLRLEACDTVIFLDTPRWVCLWRAAKRMVLYRDGGRPDIAAGCKERFDPRFFRWIWSYPRRNKPGILARLEESGKQVVRLRSDAEVAQFLAAVQESR